MNGWILIAYMLAGVYGGNSVTSLTVKFKAQVSCIAAKDYLENRGFNAVCIEDRK